MPNKIKVDAIASSTGTEVAIESGKKLSGTISQFKITDIAQKEMLYASSADTLSTMTGTASQILQMNSGATAPEFATAAAGNLKQVKTMKPGKTNDAALSHAKLGVNCANTNWATTASVPNNTTDTSLEGQILITPESSSNVIYMTMSWIVSTSITNSNWWYFIYRDGTLLTVMNADGQTQGSWPGFTQCYYVDSPATTSEITYQIRAGGYSATGDNYELFTNRQESGENLTGTAWNNGQWSCYEMAPS
jgi:hypothetical protein